MFGPLVRSRRWLLLACGSLLCGCTWIAQALQSDEQAQRRQVEQQRAHKQAEQRRQQLAQEDEQLLTTLEQRRAVVVAEQEAGEVDLQSALAYAQLVEYAHRVRATERGLIDGRAIRVTALEILALPRPQDQPSQRQLLQVQAQIYLLDDQVDRASQIYLTLIEQQPDLAVFEQLRRLPLTATTDAAVVSACPHVQSLVDEGHRHEFVEHCLARAHGQRDALSWNGVEQDLVTYEVVREQREQQAQREAEVRAREDARLAKEQAEREEEAKKLAQMQERYAYAAVFAAGRCEFGDCVHRGWTARTPDGEVRVRCEFGECLTRGWEARFPDGTTARTRCEFSECMKRGWETRFADGTTARTRCDFGECATRGWETRLPDGSTARTRCDFSECYTRGWETRMPDGSTIRCRCNFGECLERGADCG